MEPRRQVSLNVVLWVTTVAIILWLTPMVLAESTDEEMEAVPFSRPAGEAVDFSQEDGDGIIEPGEIPQEELAKAAQNPVASMISLPFQNNTNFGVGPDDKVQNVLNIQPVWPFALTDNINLITRTIVPVVSQPGIRPGEDRTTGLGNINFTAFFSNVMRTTFLISGSSSTTSTRPSDFRPLNIPADLDSNILHLLSERAE